MLFHPQSNRALIFIEQISWSLDLCKDNADIYMVELFDAGFYIEVWSAIA
jgi:hypothetical protein